MSAVMALRAKYQEDFVKKNGLKLGFMSFFVKAVVQALKEVPSSTPRSTATRSSRTTTTTSASPSRRRRASWCRSSAIATASGWRDREGDRRRGGQTAREGKITLADLEGGVFTITNGGTFGSLLSTPIINPPQSAILGMHAINERPVAVGGQVVIRPMMYVALTYDHRLVDGREAVTFLVKVKQADRGSLAAPAQVSEAAPMDKRMTWW
jgi:2-oxoglutarate dehydrogenase E2 component (dihydrolipoamide succinyltransferase)